ncbi:unnamed protein product, partial [Allacma fusca]
MLGVRNQDFTI